MDADGWLSDTRASYDTVAVSYAAQGASPRRAAPYGEPSLVGESNECWRTMHALRQ
jgi:hypothetical protein